MEEIKFYSVVDSYGEFSNFAEYPVKMKGKVWKTSEHYFQAQKFTDIPHLTKIRKAPTPMMAANLGRTRKVKIRQDWDNIKDNIMYDVVKAKFSQHKELEELLITTDTKKIIEHTENDNYWGDGGDGKGKNRLGKILMKVRDELNKSSSLKES